MKKLNQIGLILSIVILLGIGMIIPSAACSKSVEIPRKLPPAVVISIGFPGNETGLGTLTVNKGDVISLPVTVTSWAEAPVSVRIVQNPDALTPDFITLRGKNDYLKLNPSENITLDITCYISANATPGHYQAALSGELKETLPGYSKASQGFNIDINH